MKAQFIVTIEGKWLDNGRKVTAQMMERDLREAIKEQFEFLADKTTVKRHAAQVAETVPAIPGIEITSTRPAPESQQNQAVSLQDYTFAQRQIPDNSAPSGASVDSVARDAARYRWLREERDIPLGERDIPWVVALDPAERINTMTRRVGDNLDAAIDAAMSPTKAGEGEL